MTFQHDLTFSKHKKNPQALKCKGANFVEGTQPCSEIYVEMRLLIT